MFANNDTQQAMEQKLASQAEHHENAAVSHDSFNRRHRMQSADNERRTSIDSMKKHFDQANVEMCLPVKGHLELSDDESASNSIDNIAVSWFVWLVAATASIAGSLFGYDTGTLVYP